MWNKNGQMQPVNAVTSLFRALHWTDALCMCIACAAVYACSYLSAQKGALEGWVWESFVCLKLSLVPVFSEVVTEVCLGHTSYCLLNILAATAVFLRWEVLCGWRRQGDLCPGPTVRPQMGMVPVGDLSALQKWELTKVQESDLLGMKRL